MTNKPKPLDLGEFKDIFPDRVSGKKDLWSEVWKQTMNVAKSYHNWKSNKGSVNSFSRQKDKLYELIKEAVENTQLEIKQLTDNLEYEVLSLVDGIAMCNGRGIGQFKHNIRKRFKEFKNMLKI